MNVVKSLIFVAIFFMGTLFASEQKVVYDVTTGDAAQLEKALVGSIESITQYYEKNHIKYKIAIVISGKAYKYFVQDLDNSPFKGKLKVQRAQKKLAPLLTKLHSKYDVSFKMCSAGMKARKIDTKVLYHFVDADKTKSVYLIEYQNAGYAYLPVH